MGVELVDERRDFGVAQPSVHVSTYPYPPPILPPSLEAPQQKQQKDQRHPMGRQRNETLFIYLSILPTRPSISLEATPT